MAQIIAHNASFAYNGVPVIAGLNFEVSSGDYLCIIGRNGSGKSTLIKGILNLLQPASGHITMDDGLTASEIGYLPQVSLAQKDFPASVFEVVISGRLNSGKKHIFYTAEDKRIANEKIELMGLCELKNKSYQELSLGQQQKVLLARALCATKKLIILDEPTTGLDPLAQNEFYKLIRDINKNMGITIIMVSHFLNSVEEFSSHVLHLDSKQLFFGKTADYILSDYAKLWERGSL